MIDECNMTARHVVGWYAPMGKGSIFARVPGDPRIRQYSDGTVIAAGAQPSAEGDYSDDGRLFGRTDARLDGRVSANFGRGFYRRGILRHLNDAP